MKKTINIIHSPKYEIDVNKIVSIFCPDGNLYIMPDQGEPFLSFIKTIYQIEKEKNEWIRKYDRVLQGLNYWKNKAMERE